MDRWIDGWGVGVGYNDHSAVMVSPVFETCAWDRSPGGSEMEGVGRWRDVSCTAVEF